MVESRNREDHGNQSYGQQSGEDHLYNKEPFLERYGTDLYGYGKSNELVYGLLGNIVCCGNSR
jgi:hypothetical protein